MVKGESLRELVHLQRRMNQLFDEMLQPEQSPASVPEYTWTPPADVYEDASNFYVELEVPGVLIEDVEVTCEGSQLRVSGARKPMVELTPESVQRIERFFGPFFREFVFPEPLDPAKVSAHLADGVLQLTVRRKERRRAIHVT